MEGSKQELLVIALAFVQADTMVIIAKFEMTHVFKDSWVIFATMEVIPLDFKVIVGVIVFLDTVAITAKSPIGVQLGIMVRCVEMVGSRKE
jgi:hypothetical protein